MKISPQIRFNDGKCREAIAFYQDCFGPGELFIMTVGESPMAKEMPPEGQNLIMHASYNNGGIGLIFSDMMRDKAKSGDQVSLMVECDSEEQLRAHFAKLEKGGEVFLAPEKMFWGAIFAVVTDKYGVEWNFNYTLKQ